MGRVKAAFISLLVRRDKELAPGTAAGSNHEGEIIQSGQVYGDCEEPLEKLKEQWARFMDETFLAIAEEEMRLRREELVRRFETQNQRGGQHGALQGWRN